MREQHKKILVTTMNPGKIYSGPKLCEVHPDYSKLNLARLKQPFNIWKECLVLLRINRQKGRVSFPIFNFLYILQKHLSGGQHKGWAMGIITT